MIKKNMLKKLLVSILLAGFLLTTLFVPIARAQSNWYNQSFQEWWVKVYDSPETEIFGERYTAAQVEWIIYGLFAFILNKTTGDPETTACLMQSDIQDCIGRVKSLFSSSEPISTSKDEGFVSFLLKDRPLSGITYFKQKARNLKLIPAAHAQGIGFNVLDPILPIWRVSRNLAYALFVIAILIMAFMIMFRVKISPQTVITVQSALPKVTLALILITFSYAIAGLLVDLMYVVTGFSGLFLSQVIKAVGAPAAPGPTTMFTLLTQGLFGFGIFGLLMLYITTFLVVSVITLMGANGFSGLLAGAFSGLTGLAALLSVLLIIILSILLIFITIRIIWMLFKALAYVLLLTIIGPLQIALGIIIPEGGFGAWARSLAANLAVFPLTGVLFFLSYIFLLFAFFNTINSFWPESLGEFVGDFFLGIPGANLVSAAVTHKGWPPLLVLPVKNFTALIYLGVSIVILFVLPKTTDLIKSMIERKPFAFGTAIGEAVLPAPVRMIYGSDAARSIKERVGAESAQRALDWLNKKTGWSLLSKTPIGTRK